LCWLAKLQKIRHLADLVFAVPPYIFSSLTIPYGMRRKTRHRLLGSRLHERLGGTAMKHFTTEEWIDFANELVAIKKRKEMDQHLGEGCPRCNKTLSLWQKVRQAAKSAAESQPP